MRYSLINGLLLLAVSPLTSLALPVDPNDQSGVWDPSGQYRKGHYVNGQFVPNAGSQYNNGQWNNGQNNNNGQYQNGEYNNGQYNNGQYNENGNTEYNNGEYNNNNNNNGEYNRYQRRGMNARPFGNGRPRVGIPGVRIPGLNARSWPYDNNQQGGWTDANGQWHSNNDQNGWTDANGQWHSNTQNNQNGWYDNNGQWHANAKRGVGLPGVGVPGIPGIPAGTNRLNHAAESALHVRWNRPENYNGNDGYYNNDGSYNNDGYSRSGESEREREREEDREDNREDAADAAEAATSVIDHLKARNYPNDEHRIDSYNNYGYTNYDESERERKEDREEDRATAADVTSTVLNGLKARESSDENAMYSTGYHDDIEGRNGRNAVADVLTSTPTVPVPVKRWWPFTSGSDRNNDNYDNDNDNYGYQDKCKSNDEEDRSGWDCRHDWDANRHTTPTPRVWARNYPNDQYNSNYPQATPGAQNGNYGNYKNYGSYQNYPTDGQTQNQNLKATGGEKQ